MAQHNQSHTAGGRAHTSRTEISGKAGADGGNVLM